MEKDKERGFDDGFLGWTSCFDDETRLTRVSPGFSNRGLMQYRNDRAENWRWGPREPLGEVYQSWGNASFQGVRVEGFIRRTSVERATAFSRTKRAKGFEKLRGGVLA